MKSQVIIFDGPLIAVGGKLCRRGSQFWFSSTTRPCTSPTSSCYWACLVPLVMKSYKLELNQDAPWNSNISNCARKTATAKLTIVFASGFNVLNLDLDLMVLMSLKPFKAHQHPVFYGCNGMYGYDVFEIETSYYWIKCWCISYSVTRKTIVNTDVR